MNSRALQLQPAVDQARQRSEEALAKMATQQQQLAKAEHQLGELQRYRLEYATGGDGAWTVGALLNRQKFVERIDQVPRTLIYASDLAGQRIKDEILKPDGNPFQKGFIVDLDVETVGGRPKVYRVIAVHEVIDLDE